MVDVDPAQVEAHFKEAFDEVSGGDGKITHADLKAALEKAGAKPDDDQIQAIIDAADQDGTGEIGFEEFCAVIATAAFTKLRIIAVLRILYTAVGSGAVSLDDLKAAIEEKGLGDQIPQDKIDAIAEAMEGREPGDDIDIEAFLEALQNADI